MSLIFTSNTAISKQIINTSSIKMNININFSIKNNFLMIRKEAINQNQNRFIENHKLYKNKSPLALKKLKLRKKEFLNKRKI